MALSPTARRWARLITAQQLVNLPTRAFAAQHDVNPSTLNWWRARLRKEAPTFIEVRIASSTTPPSSAPLRLQLTAVPLSIDVPVGTDLAWLRAVVQALS